MAAHEADPGHRPRHQEGRQGARQEPRIEIVRRPVDIDIAAREERPDQRRAMGRRRLEELVDIGILGPAQHRQWAAIGEIVGVKRAAMRRIQDERQGVAMRVAAPQHTRNLETRRDAAHPVHARAAAAADRFSAAASLRGFCHRIAAARMEGITGRLANTEGFAGRSTHPSGGAAPIRAESPPYYRAAGT